LRLRRRAEGNERGVGGLLIPLEKRGKGGVGYYSLDARREGTSRLRDIGRVDQRERTKKEEVGRRPKATCGTQAGNCIYDVVLAVWIGGGVDERLTVDT
jgi:hypothetical protein